MGKGIAYQFKLKYPKNNLEYEKQCRVGNFNIGSILAFNESNKLILNFPTKDKWRKKSEYSYIKEGLNTLVQRLPNLSVRSIAFPPLGCGNGGLDWGRVKEILISELSPYKDEYDFILYEPSTNINRVKNIKKIPKLNASHLILMKLKIGLNKFNKTRLQKGAFLINIFSHEEYFKFNAYNYGPYNHSLDIISRDIREFQEYYNYTTEQAFEAAKKTLVSDSVNEKLKKFSLPVLNAVKFLNDIESDREVELITTILYIILTKRTASPDLLPNEFEKWSKDKANRFSTDEIKDELDFLRSKGLVINSLMGVELNNTLPNIVYK
ncbi:MAG: macro domain-containing protein [Bacteroidales bacterium]|nr:macro domain-containing protein [Bacteroidales bacterium]